MTTIGAGRTSPSAHRPVSRLRRLQAGRWSPAVLVAGLVLISTAVVDVITPSVPVEAAGVFYLVVVLGASSLYGLRWGLIASVASAAVYSFFFLPPAHTLLINDSSDWLALGAFVITAVVTSELAARARQGREEAARRAAEAQMGEGFATLIATAESIDDVLPALAGQAAMALGATGGRIVRDAEGTVGGVRLELDGRPVGVLLLEEAPAGTASSAAACRLARTLSGLIVLGDERDRRMRAQVQAQALIRSDELKTALLRAVSHDLRSPLMAITTAAGGLEYADLDDDERELLGAIVDQASGMSHMIDNLLDMSKLSAGAILPESDWIDVRDVVDASAECLAVDRRDRVRVDAQPSPLARCDPAQLERVVVNLLENALKFSPEGGPVEVTVRPVAGAVEIAVTDAGPGIPEPDLPHIFEPFHRAPQPGGTGGSGLGLAIADGLARANGCRLSVDSEPGRTTFTVWIPTPAATP
ncbi:MAG: ATP-binding protein [Gaiellales bacterium]